MESEEWIMYYTFEAKAREYTLLAGEAKQTCLLHFLPLQQHHHMYLVRYTANREILLERIILLRLYKIRKKDALPESPFTVKEYSSLGIQGEYQGRVKNSKGRE
jgi:hypothetical protein